MVSKFHDSEASENHGRQPKCRAVTIKRAWSGLGTISTAEERQLFRVRSFSASRREIAHEFVRKGLGRSQEWEIC